MTYYTALINAWNSATQPPTGVTGTPLTGLTTAQKLIAINSWTVTGAVPTTLYVTGAQVANCINYAEFKALTFDQQSQLLALCSQTGQLLGGSANAGLLAAGMILDFFSHTGPTVIALTALAQAIVQPWWQANGYTSPISAADLVEAGGLT